MSAPDDLDALLEFLATAKSYSDFEAYLEIHPNVLEHDVIEHLADMQRKEPSFAGSAALFERLLRQAQVDPRVAWAEYTEELKRMNSQGDEVANEMRHIDQLGKEGRWQEVVEAVDILIPKVREIGAGLIEAKLQRDAGVATLHMSKADPSLLASAKERLEAALALIPGPEAADPMMKALASDILMNLGVANAEDSELDPEDAFDLSIEQSLAALDHVSPKEDADSWATGHTNLCRAWRERRRGDHRENLEHAEEHGRLALSVRSPKSDADRWVISQLNYADTLDAKANAGVGDRRVAEMALREVVDAAGLLTHQWPAALAHLGLAAPIAAEARSLRDTDEKGAIELEAMAEPHYERALELTALDAPSGIRGRICLEVGSFEAVRGDYEKALTFQTEALSRLFPAMPPAARAAAKAMGEIYAFLGRWEEAADAYLTAVEAAHLSFHARLYESSQQVERVANNNLGRFAAFALAKAGREEEAVQVLEDMRALEFQRRIGGSPADLEALAEQDQGLHDSYLECLATLRGQPISGVPDEVSRELVIRLRVIREIPGLENFAATARIEDVVQAAEAHGPLIYVDPTPHGTLLLTVALGPGGDALVNADFIEATSAVIWQRLSFGAYEEMLAGVPAAELPASYLGTAAGLVEDRVVEEALDYILDWLGTFVAEPIGQRLGALSATSVTLIPCGPVSAAPLHIARWETPEGRRCLLDSFEVKFAPSALVAVASRRQKERTTIFGGQLTAVANPVGGLYASEAEVRQIATGFDMAEVAIGREASPAFLLQNAPPASVIHLACHARADVMDLSRSVIELADNQLVTLAELAAIDASQARLICASACQTAIPNLDDGDEALSVASALLAAGAAGSVATLWEVHDLPTAMLMVRFYEELGAGHGPQTALRISQLWLRDATVGALEAYMRERPPLQAAYERAIAKNELPGQFEGDSEVAPWRNEVYWGAFVLHGS